MHSAELNVPQNHVYLFKPHNEKRRGKSAALGMDMDEHLFSRYGEWRRGKFVAGGCGAEIVHLV